MRYQSSRTLRGFLLTTTALVAALAGGGKGAAAAGSASGLSGFQVQSGGATLSTPSATKSVITQSTNKAIIGWSAFGIPAGSTVQFVQPGASSVALNRVTGGNVSQIMGNLTANGQVWIVNPAGVFFGAGAQVDVAGLMATTSDIQNGNFLSGNYQFGIGSQNPNAGIVNQGTIRVSPGGSAVLAGATVTNQGLIEAQLGSVVLAGAKTFTVDFQGDKLLSFQVTGAVDQRPMNADGSPANALVTNSGTVSASGGTVLLTARAAKNIIDNVINSSGIVEAQSAKSVNGEIVLDGGDTGAVTVTGTLDASGQSAGQTGGTVKVLGNQVALASTASINVSGDAGGGTALIGGNFHGAGPEQNAATTTVSAGARINASAITNGNGGKVAVWSNTATSFGGTITATGGSLGGNGGYVETSGQSLSIGATAKVNTFAVKGTAGSWLLDPADATIGTASGDISPGAMVAALGSGEVIVEAGNVAGAGTGSITVDASTGNALVYSSPNQLSLLAVGNIIANAPIQNTSNGNINLVAGWSLGTGVGAGAGSVFQAGDTASPSGVPGAFNPALLTSADYGLGGGSVTSSSSIMTAGGNLNVLGAAVSISGQVSAAGVPGTTGMSGGTISIMANSGAASLGSVNASGANQTNATQVAGSGGMVVVDASSISISSLISANGGNANFSGPGGSGGAITLDATSGALSAKTVSTVGGNALTGNAGTGGSVTLAGSSVGLVGQLATQGGNVTGAAGGRGGDGGAIQIASTGDVTLGQNGGPSILALGGTSKGSGGGGNAGGVSITSSGGSIMLAAGIQDRGGGAYGSSGNGGNGGNIALMAPLGAISIGFTPFSNTIIARGGDARGLGNAGNAGNIVFSAFGNISIGNAGPGYQAVLDRGGDSHSTLGGNGGNAGAIGITSTGGSISVAATINDRGGNVYSGPGNGGNAGSIALSAFGDISIGATGGNAAQSNHAIQARGGDAGVSGNGGNGAAVSITAGGLVTIDTSAGNNSIQVRGGDVAAGVGGTGGSIVITAGAIATSGPLESRGGDALIGTLGATNGGLGGNAGGISLVATTGDISIGANTGTLGFLPDSLGNPLFFESINARGGDTDGTAGGGAGASVILSAPSGSITAGAGLAAGTTLSPTFSSAISTRGGDDLSTLSGTGGNAGSIIVNAAGAVALGTVNTDEAAGINSMVVARGGDAAAGHGGNANTVSILGSSLTLSGVNDQGGASTASVTGGSGGAITLTTAGGVGTVTLLSYTPASGAGPGVNAGGGFAGLAQNGTPGSIEIDGHVIASEAPTLANSLQTPTLGLSVVGVGGTPSVVVNGDIDASASGAEALRIMGSSNGANVTLGPVGASTPLSSIYIDPGSIFLDGSTYRTTGNQSYVDPVVLLTNASLIAGTGGVTLGTVSTGTRTFAVIADNVSLNGAWTGTGARTVAPFSPLSIGLAGASGTFQLGTTALGYLANGNTAPVTIGSTTAGAVTSKSFTFNAPLTIKGSSITIKGTLNKALGGLSLLAFNGSQTGAVTGAVSLAAGTGNLIVEGSSLNLTQSTINGIYGKGAANDVTLIGPIGPGPYTVDNGKVP